MIYDRIENFRKNNKRDVIAFTQGSLLVDDIVLDEAYADFISEYVQFDFFKQKKDGVYLLSYYDCQCDRREHNAYTFVWVQFLRNEVIWKKIYQFYSPYKYSFEIDQQKEEVFAILTGYENTFLGKINAQVLDKGEIGINNPYVFDRKQYFKVCKSYVKVQEAIAKKTGEIAKKRELAEKSTNARVLRRLTKETDWEIKKCLVANPKTDEASFRKLCNELAEEKFDLPLFTYIIELPQERIDRIMNSQKRLSDEEFKNEMQKASEEIINFRKFTADYIQEEYQTAVKGIEKSDITAEEKNKAMRKIQKEYESCLKKSKE